MASRGRYALRTSASRPKRFPRLRKNSASHSVPAVVHGARLEACADRHRLPAPAGRGNPPTCRSDSGSVFVCQPNGNCLTGYPVSVCSQSSRASALLAGWRIECVSALRIFPGINTGFDPPGKRIQRQLEFAMRSLPLPNDAASTWSPPGDWSRRSWQRSGLTRWRTSHQSV